MGKKTCEPEKLACEGGLRSRFTGSSELTEGTLRPSIGLRIQNLTGLPVESQSPVGTPSRSGGICLAEMTSELEESRTIRSSSGGVERCTLPCLPSHLRRLVFQSRTCHRPMRTHTTDG